MNSDPSPEPATLRSPKIPERQRKNRRRRKSDIRLVGGDDDGGGGNGAPTSYANAVKLCPFHINIDATLAHGNPSNYDFPSNHPLVQPVLKPFMPSGFYNSH